MGRMAHLQRFPTKTKEMASLCASRLWGKLHRGIPHTELTDLLIKGLNNLPHRQLYRSCDQQTQTEQDGFPELLMSARGKVSALL